MGSRKHHGIQLLVLCEVLHKPCLAYKCNLTGAMKNCFTVASIIMSIGRNRYNFIRLILKAIADHTAVIRL